MIEHLEYWRAQTRWTLEQASQLLCDREPASDGFNREAPDPGGPNDIYNRLKNAKDDSEIEVFPARGNSDAIRLQRVKARDVVAWAIRNRWTVPDSLRDLATAPPVTEPADNPHISENLAWVNRAAVEFWSTASADDPETQPKNQEVIEWLRGKGMSEALASAAASIIRPSWAFTGRRPEK